MNRSVKVSVKALLKKYGGNAHTAARILVDGMLRNDYQARQVAKGQPGLRKQLIDDLVAVFTEQKTIEIHASMLPQAIDESLLVKGKGKVR